MTPEHEDHGQDEYDDDYGDDACDDDVDGKGAVSPCRRPWAPA